jgi:hypothetical protein
MEKKNNKTFNAAEPMYREIPQHIPVGTALDKNEAEQKRQRIAWQKAHKVWYL